jgi:hypothetical protein
VGHVPSYILGGVCHVSSPMCPGLTGTPTKREHEGQLVPHAGDHPDQYLRQYKPYYALGGPNLSKLCVSCTFKFLISVTPYLQTGDLGVSLGGVAVKHRQLAR